MSSKLVFAILVLFSGLSVYADSDVQCSTDVVNSPSKNGIESILNAPVTLADGTSMSSGVYDTDGGLNVHLERHENTVTASIFEMHISGDMVSYDLVKKESASFTDADILAGGKIFFYTDYLGAKYGTSNSPKEVDVHCYAPVKLANADKTKVSDTKEKGVIDLGIASFKILPSDATSVK